jgi:hypothetical protein
MFTFLLTISLAFVPYRFDTPKPLKFTTARVVSKGWQTEPGRTCFIFIDDNGEVRERCS